MSVKFKEIMRCAFIPSVTDSVGAGQVGSYETDFLLFLLFFQNEKKKKTVGS